jgi:hypothetical protein
MSSLRFYFWWLWWLWWLDHRSVISRHSSQLASASAGAGCFVGEAVAS